MANAIANEETNGASPARNLKPTKKVRFFRNGDSFFDGFSFAVGDRFRTFDSLMTALTNSNQLGDNRVLPKGVRYVFTMDGRKLTSLDELQDGESYVVSSTDAFKKINYAKVASPNWNPSMRGGAVHKRMDDDYSKRREPDKSFEVISKELTDISSQKGRVFVVVRNGIKPRKIARILLNARLAHSFDQVLDMIGMSFQTPPVKKIFTFDRRQVINFCDFTLIILAFLAAVITSQPAAFVDYFADRVDAVPRHYHFGFRNRKESRNRLHAHRIR